MAIRWTNKFQLIVRRFDREGNELDPMIINQSSDPKGSAAQKAQPDDENQGDGDGLVPEGLTGGDVPAVPIGVEGNWDIANADNAAAPQAAWGADQSAPQGNW